MNLPVLSVTQVNTYIKSLIDGDRNLSDIFIRGEISNFKRHSSGHLYLTLKDENSRLPAVMFRFNAAKMRFLPQDGMRVLVRGRISVYDRDGKYQLYIEEMHPDGVGDLSVAYEQMKERLAAEGLFDEAHKKALPRYPQRVGVITSPTGAAVHDIITVLSRRFPVASLILCPVHVQGDEAVGDICEALDRFNRMRAADVIILGRGGGSVEDLWAFNEEPVARAVYRSQIPVVSAVGHETDFTICDFVADVRAATPSAAAELAVPDARELMARLAGFRLKMVADLSANLEAKKSRLSAIGNMSCFKNPLSLIESRRQQLDERSSDLEAGIHRVAEEKRRALSAAAASLELLSPLKILGRGYSIALGAEKQIIKSINDTQKGESIVLRVTDGQIWCTVDQVGPKTEEL